MTFDSMSRSFPTTLLMTISTGQLLPPHTVGDLLDFFKYYLQDHDIQMCELHLLRNLYHDSIQDTIIQAIGSSWHREDLQSYRWPIEHPFEAWFSRNHSQLSSSYQVYPLVAGMQVHAL